MDDLYTISCSSLPDTTRVAGFCAVESMSKPFHVKVYLIVPSDGLDLSDAIGAKTCLTIDRQADAIPAVAFAGIFGTIELLHESDGQALVQGVIVPQLWTLGLSQHSRIFTKASLPEILDIVLQDNGLAKGTDYDLHLGSYAKEDHVCQYEESDLAFLSRWMEREGIYYYFEHTDSGEKLIICDSKAYASDPIGDPVRYHPQVGGDLSAGMSFRTFRCRQTTLPGTVKLTDYDYAKPNLDVSGSAKVSANGTAEVSVHGHRFFTPTDGSRLATLRAQELLAREIVFQALGTRLHLRPGYVFELEEHPRTAFNDKYLTIEATHWGKQAIDSQLFKQLIDIPHEDTYVVEIFAIPAKTQFRPDRLTAWPRIYGYENGTVDGPADSDFAQIDDQGRYAVKFKFDESALKDGKASTFVRMMQPHGGSPEGFHFPLRKNTEVVFSFLGGDPDRPVISGVVPNLVNPSPVTKTNHTTNVINTGANNRLELEDSPPWVELSSPALDSRLFLGTITSKRDHNFVLNTQGTGLIRTHSDMDIVVEGELHEKVTLDVHEEYAATKETEITKAVTETYKDTVTQTYSKHHDITVEAGGRKEEITGLYDQTVKGGGWTQDIKGGPGLDQEIGPKWHTDVKGPWSFEATKVDWNIGEKAGDVEINCGEWKCTQSSEVFWTCLTNKFEKTVGIVSEFIGGMKNDMVIGVVTDTLIGGKLETIVGSSIGLNIGPKFETEGMKAEIKMLHLKSAALETHETGVEMKEVATKIAEHATQIKQNGIDIALVGFLMRS